MSKVAWISVRVASGASAWQALEVAASEADVSTSARGREHGFSSSPEHRRAVEA